MRNRFSPSALVLLLPWLLGGCQQTISPQEQGTIAQAYAEMLIVKNMVAGDSAHAKRAIDSVLNAHGFDSEIELQAKLKQLTTTPDQFRQTMDSAQRILEAAQNEAADPMKQ